MGNSLLRKVVAWAKVVFEFYGVEQVKVGMGMAVKHHYPQGSELNFCHSEI